MPKPIIAIDVDDVLVPHFAGLLRWYNTTYGTQLTEVNNHSKDIAPWGAATVDEAISRVIRYFESDEFKHEQPYEAAVAALQKLSQTYDLIVITGRDEIIEAVTEAWLKQHFPDLFREVHFTRQYSQAGKSRPKAEVLTSTQARYFIDDYLPAVTEAAEQGIETILFGDYGWNQADSLPTRVTRCKDWQAVLQYFEGVAHG